MAFQETPTPAQQAAATFRSEAARLQSVLISSHQVLYRAVWSGDDPQAVLDELGPFAGKAFITGAKLVELILTNEPSALTEEQYLPKQVPTLNQDGTVTLEPLP